MYDLQGSFHDLFAEAPKRRNEGRADESGSDPGRPLKKARADDDDGDEDAAFERFVRAVDGRIKTQIEQHRQGLSPKVWRVPDDSELNLTDAEIDAFADENEVSRLTAKKVLFQEKTYVAQRPAMVFVKELALQKNYAIPTDDQIAAMPYADYKDFLTKEFKGLASSASEEQRRMIKLFDRDNRGALAKLGKRDAPMKEQILKATLHFALFQDAGKTLKRFPGTRDWLLNFLTPTPAGAINVHSLTPAQYFAYLLLSGNTLPEINADQMTARRGVFEFEENLGLYDQIGRERTDASDETRTKMTLHFAFFEDVDLPFQVFEVPKPGDEKTPAWTFENYRAFLEREYPSKRKNADISIYKGIRSKDDRIKKAALHLEYFDSTKKTETRFPGALKSLKRSRGRDVRYESVSEGYSSENREYSLDSDAEDMYERSVIERQPTVLGQRVSRTSDPCRANVIEYYDIALDGNPKFKAELDYIISPEGRAKAERDFEGLGLATADLLQKAYLNFAVAPVNATFQQSIKWAKNCAESYQIEDVSDEEELEEEEDEDDEEEDEEGADDAADPKKFNPREFVKRLLQKSGGVGNAALVNLFKRIDRNGKYHSSPELGEFSDFGFNSQSDMFKAILYYAAKRPAKRPQEVGPLFGNPRGLQFKRLKFTQIVDPPNADSIKRRTRDAPDWDPEEAEDDESLSEGSVDIEYETREYLDGGNDDVESGSDDDGEMDMQTLKRSRPVFYKAMMTFIKREIEQKMFSDTGEDRPYIEQTRPLEEGTITEIAEAVISSATVDGEELYVAGDLEDVALTEDDLDGVKELIRKKLYAMKGARTRKIKRRTLLLLDPKEDEEGTSDANADKENPTAPDPEIAAALILARGDLEEAFALLNIQ